MELIFQVFDYNRFNQYLLMRKFVRRILWRGRYADLTSLEKYSLKLSLRLFQGHVSIGELLSIPRKTLLIKIAQSFALMSICWGATDFGKGKPDMLKSSKADQSHTLWRLRHGQSNCILGQYAPLGSWLVNQGSLLTTFNAWNLLFTTTRPTLMQLPYL